MAPRDDGASRDAVPCTRDVQGSHAARGLTHQDQDLADGAGPDAGDLTAGCLESAARPVWRGTRTRKRNENQLETAGGKR